MNAHRHRLLLVYGAAFLLFTVPATPAQEPGDPAPAGVAHVRRPPDLKILFWYDRQRPLETFRYQVYDVRRGEYTPAVDRWLTDVGQTFKGYRAYVRDVSLSAVRGDTDRHKTGTAITDEFHFVAAEHGYDLGPARAGLAGTRGGSSISPTRPFRPIIPPSPRMLAPPANTSPFPIPYARPHP